MIFKISSDVWQVKIVDPDSPALIDRTGRLTVATTSPVYRIIYLSKNLNGDFLQTVFRHELGHCLMITYNLLPELHQMVKPEYWVLAEEWVCNFLADYSPEVNKIVKDIFGGNV